MSQGKCGYMGSEEPDQELLSEYWQSRVLSLSNNCLFWWWYVNYCDSQVSYCDVIAMQVLCLSL